MAHKKASGSTTNGRDSIGRRLGIKIFGGQHAIAGNILVRQRGTKHNAADGVGMGKDHTLFAMIDGTVTYLKRRGRSYVTIIAKKGVGKKEAMPKKEVVTQSKAEEKKTSTASDATTIKEAKKPVASSKANSSDKPALKKSSDTSGKSGDSKKK